MQAEDKNTKNAVLTNFGARRALNYITDIARGRKVAVTFILDPSTGNVIEVEIREHRNM